MADYKESEVKSEEFAPAPVKVEESDSPAVETSDRGLFGFGKKDEEKKSEDEVIASEFDHKVQICPAKTEEPEQEEGEKHESLLEKLHRSDSSSSSSSDEEEVEEGGEKKKKKKGLKDKLKEKITGEDDKKEEKAEVPYEETSIPIEKTDESEQKKGFLEKIKEKLPGGKITEDVSHPAPPPPQAVEYSETSVETEGKEKKGFLEKIKEKIPGLHSKLDEDHKDKDTSKVDA